MIGFRGSCLSGRAGLIGWFSHVGWRNCPRARAIPHRRVAGVSGVKELPPGAGYLSTLSTRLLIYKRVPARAYERALRCSTALHGSQECRERGDDTSGRNRCLGHVGRCPRAHESTWSGSFASSTHDDDLARRYGVWQAMPPAPQLAVSASLKTKDRRFDGAAIDGAATATPTHSHRCTQRTGSRLRRPTDRGPGSQPPRSRHHRPRQGQLIEGSWTRRERQAPQGVLRTPLVWCPWSKPQTTPQFHAQDTTGDTTTLVLATPHLAPHAVPAVQGPRHHTFWPRHHNSCQPPDGRGSRFTDEQAPLAGQGRPRLRVRLAELRGDVNNGQRTIREDVHDLRFEAYAAGADP